MERFVARVLRDGKVTIAKRLRELLNVVDGEECEEPESKCVQSEGVVSEWCDDEFVRYTLGFFRLFGERL